MTSSERVASRFETASATTTWKERMEAAENEYMNEVADVLGNYLTGAGCDIQSISSQFVKGMDNRGQQITITFTRKGSDLHVRCARGSVVMSTQADLDNMTPRYVAMNIHGLDIWRDNLKGKWR